MAFAAPDAIRARFSAAMSGMYRLEMPQYGMLLKLVDDSELPDDWTTLRRQGFAFFRYSGSPARRIDLEDAIGAGDIVADPILYEDFLPVSAAGIFQSNLGDEARGAYRVQANRAAFAAALGAPLLDEFELYEAIEARSLPALAA